MTQRGFLKQCLFWSAVAALVIFPADAREKKAKDSGSGNLAVIDFRVHPISTGGVPPRVVAQILVENQSPVPRTGPYAVEIRRKGEKQALGVCENDEGIPGGQVVLCELWLDDMPVRQNDAFEAYLNRNVGDFNRWDGDPADDVKSYDIRTTAEGGQVLRIANFEVLPRTVQGPSEVQFRFQVEGAHLIWLVSGDNPPRLLAGHPADGLLNGKGRERVTLSGPVTLVARNSFGAFVYQAIPVLNLFQPLPHPLAEKPKAEEGEPGQLRVLDPGVYDVDQDQSILENIRSFLAKKNWIAALEGLREEATRPRAASAINPMAQPGARPPEEPAPEAAPEADSTNPKK